MEAGNLGAYLADKSSEEITEALELIRAKTEGFDYENQDEFLDVAAAKRVIKRFGNPTYMPSLGVPTWKYGHEPSNVFATWQAKIFSNAIREDGLIQIANCGIVYSPGSAGTRQEIFQDACRNHYAEPEKSCPMVFYGEKFWKENSVFDLVQSTAEGRPYQSLLLCSDSIEEITQHFINYREQRGLPKIEDLKSLKKPFWFSCTNQAHKHDEN